MEIGNEFRHSPAPLARLAWARLRGWLTFVSEIIQTAHKSRENAYYKSNGLHGGGKGKVERESVNSRKPARERDRD